MDLTELVTFLRGGGARAVDFMDQGGPIVWTIGGVSVLTLAVIIWKVLHLFRLGVWSGGRRTERAVADWRAGRDAQALERVLNRRSARARVAVTAFEALSRPEFTPADAERDIVRVARGRLAAARSGLKLLELIATIAPLLGLLGTVVGMIAAFQALQEAGSRADPAALAGGIWEALLTTAAGMGVAIPATMAASWFESQVDRLRRDIEDICARILLPRKTDAGLRVAAQ
ncbi:MotA/TolQ/ExbB proton channel family protein [Tropicimonas sp. IMCC34011]|uniref:MotA/TolQ/ExbB proton channel family protein n=1 Tax=Tropicimonas sp. IMCC34011 TaxID=2248759 RepID=UPI000E220895|nr:MotA/TolQ/ExbB proton channel family protein [Tropicimonas sp. IMCC34011]